MSEPKPRFTGIFIPVEVLELEGVSLLETLLLSWIDALYDREKGGCWASNGYLASRLKVKENTVAKALTNLRKLELIEDVTFNGRQRVIRARIGEVVSSAQQADEPGESNAALDKRPGGGWTKIQPRVGGKSIPSLYKRKDERKGKNIAQSPAEPGREQRPGITFCHDSKSFVGITPKDRGEWQTAYPDISIDRELARAQQWVLANPSKSKKRLWRKFLVNWFVRTNDKAENRKAYRSAANSSVDRRTTNMDGSPVYSPADDIF